jgi:hypothetical protein
MIIPSAVGTTLVLGLLVAVSSAARAALSARFEEQDER